MKNLWLDIGNTRLKYWITENDQIVEHAAELHLQSPAELLLGLILHFKNLDLQQVGVSSVQDKKNNERIQKILKFLNVPVTFAKVHAEYAGLRCAYEDTSKFGIDRWLQMLAVVNNPAQKYCVISCGTALTIDLTDGLQHLGGYILPNLYLQRDSLIQNTKGIKIPDATFDELSPGRNTIDAVHHGILLSLVSTIEKVLQKYPSQLILTGGDASLFAKYLAQYQPVIEPDLLLKGLQNYIYSLAEA
ncbi:type III pantothenate kinase [Acinetobacter sp. ANC 4216]|uniref:type III pantothenate kinase n=1 Tax=unclassified Acinetobacter TaxID=196816 RepID=UPI00103A4D4C|nr:MULTISPECIES: type III pantothenate kinase [unclassified Acinetobacter]MCT8089864.1 type III pantothenate kinase [Acinetobacter sp. F_3_1]MCT8098499.1 type III pantothenate kinase [Acinetobacter sp. C_3_1]MCT8101393.1 type III pantothenate kinase [Acinetobacter sp. C_4_1]MCT8135280.1 type III pantothenate kinase [Acinetobacter sp. T_3_1]TCB70779.1 type III pantothenate kinase [Acinetobacter sp. ANC 4216]